MKIYKLKDMHKGWFVGNFEPSCFKTEQFEVCYRTHKKGETWEHHYHKQIIEINLLTKGEMTLHGKKLQTGDVFILYPYEVADPVFTEDCDIVCIKTPSIPSDKVVFKETE